MREFHKVMCFVVIMFGGVSGENAGPDKTYKVRGTEYMSTSRRSRGPIAGPRHRHG